MSPYPLSLFRRKPSLSKPQHERSITMSTHHLRLSRLFQQMPYFIYHYHNGHVRCSHRLSRCNRIGLYFTPNSGFFYQQNPGETFKSARTRRAHKTYPQESVWEAQKGPFIRNGTSKERISEEATSLDTIHKDFTGASNRSPPISWRYHLSWQFPYTPTLLDYTSQGPLMSGS